MYRHTRAILTHRRQVSQPVDAFVGTIFDRPILCLRTRHELTTGHRLGQLCSYTTSLPEMLAMIAYALPAPYLRSHISDH